MKDFLFWFPKVLLFVLLILTYSLYERNSSLAETIERRDARISELNKELDLEKQRFSNLDEVVSNTTQQIIELETDKSNTQKEIEDLEKRKKNDVEDKVSPSSALDPELISLLNSACARVRGSTCPDP